MLFSNIAYLDENYRIQTGKYIAVRGNRIDYVGDTAPAMDGETRVYDGKNRLLLPAFFNAHCHMPMSLLRGYGENMSLADWLNLRIFPFEEHLKPDDIYWATLLGCLEMLRFGIAGVSDMYMRGDAMARAFLQGGVKANMSAAVACFDDSAYSELRHCAETRQLIEQYHHADDGRIIIDFALHAEYTSTEKVARGIAEAAAAAGKAMHVHVSETADEVAGCRNRHGGRSPVRYLADCGLFDIPTVAAHCVHIDAADIAILAEKKVSVATCPKSNLKLASGVCPVNALLEAGVNVALGTDSVASNNNFDFIEELRFFTLLPKGIAHDPTLISPAEAIHAATRAGALAQGRDDSGIIAPGFRADITVLDISGPQWLPAHDLLNNLVYSACGSDVALTMVDGAVRYENNDWPGLDKEKIHAEVEARRLRILDELRD